MYTATLLLLSNVFYFLDSNPSGHQKWLAGKSTIYIEHFTSELLASILDGHVPASHV
jgi:hypothetical protein